LKQHTTHLTNQYQQLSVDYEQLRLMVMDMKSHMDGTCAPPLTQSKELMSYPKCRSVKVINNPARPGSNHREVNYINYK